MARRNLSRQRILEAAVAYADEHGVEALTMRRVAEVLQCGVMSLYNHVSNKDEMIVGMVDHVVADIALPSEEGDWKDALRACATSANAVLLAHPWAPAEWTRRMPGPARTAFMDGILGALTRGELGDALVYKGYHAVTMHIVGFSLQEIGYRQALDGDLEELAGAFLGSLGDAYPHMAEHVRAHLDHRHDDEDEFGFVLDLILDGLERAADLG